MVALSTSLANNDAEEFPAPFEVSLERNPRHIAFGTGIHRCLGAPLALSMWSTPRSASH